MYNLDIRNRAKERGVKLWEIAEYIGINPTTLTVWLRHELPEGKKKVMFAAIDAIAARR